MDCRPGGRLSYLFTPSRLAGCIGDQPLRPSRAAGRSASPKAPGPGSAAADRPGAMESRRSDGFCGASRTHPEIGLGGIAGETGDGARLAPCTGAKEVGGLPRPTAPWSAADLRGVPPADCPDGARNPGWGYFRIRGELLKLGHQVAATTIRSVLLAAGVPPTGRRSQLTWKQFLTAHAETLVAADFFSVDTIFFKRLYVLIYVHLASRRV